MIICVYKHFHFIFTVILLSAFDDIANSNNIEQFLITFNIARIQAT